MSHVVPERIPALTIWQPWATLIMEGLKPFEFRRWPAPARLQGRRIAIHAGARPARRGEIAALLLQLSTDAGRGTGLRPIGEAITLLERFHLSPQTLPLASVLGTAVLGHPVKAGALAGAAGVLDSDRIDHHVWGWPLTGIEPCRPPVPARGAQGFWMWETGAHG